MNALIIIPVFHAQELELEDPKIRLIIVNVRKDITKMEAIWIAKNVLFYAKNVIILESV